MQLKSYTDYSLRVLIYLGIHSDRQVTISEVAQVFRISRNHLMKVAQQLASLGYVSSVPGRNGGLRLGREPAAINVGEVIQRMEHKFDVVECFDPRRNSCCLSSSCILQGMLRDAMNQFLTSLERYTLQDLLHNQESLARVTTLRSAPDEADRRGETAPT